MCYREHLRMSMDKLKSLDEELEAQFPRGHQDAHLLLFEPLEVLLQTHYKNLDSTISRTTQDLYRKLSRAGFVDLMNLVKLSSSKELHCSICHLAEFSDDGEGAPWGLLQALTGSFRTCRKHYFFNGDRICPSLDSFSISMNKADSLFRASLIRCGLYNDLPDIARQNMVFIHDDVIFSAVKFRYQYDSFMDTDWTSLDCLGRTWLHQILDVTPRASARVLWEMRLEDLQHEIRRKVYIKYKIGKEDISGRTVLHIACQKGYSDFVEVLLDKGAGPLQETFCGLQPLHLAAMSGSVETCKILLRHIPPADIRNVDKFGRRPIDYALANRHPKVVHLLHPASDLSPHVYPTNKTPLLIDAVRQNDLPRVQLLIPGFADPNMVFKVSISETRASSPLFEALYRNRISGNFVIADFLLLNGAAIDAVLYDNGKTALHILSTRCFPLCVYFLLNKGADMSIRDDEGRTALMYASKHNQILTPFLRMHPGLDLLELTDIWGRSAIDYAREEENDVGVRKLEDAIAAYRRPPLPTPSSMLPELPL
jgi:ankyrin repeat protein